MIEVPIYNQAGTKVDTLQGRRGQARRRGPQATCSSRRWSCTTPTSGRAPSSTQARGEVAGSTRKMFRQKGTGNARTGGIRNPIKKGGGHAKQKRPKDWRQAMPKKARRLARNSAILAQAPEQRRPRRRRDQARQPQDQAGRRDVQGAGHRPQRACSRCTGRDENAREVGPQHRPHDADDGRPAQRVGHPAEPHAADDEGRAWSRSWRNATDTDERTIMDNTNVIIKPLVTEKSTHQQTTRNAYAFQVHAGANKHADQGRRSRSMYNVKVRRRAHDEPQGQAAPDASSR